MNPYEFLKPRAPMAAAASPGGRTGKRLYAAANYTRLTADWAPSSTSSDAEIVMSLRRNRSRQLIRDNEYALNGLRMIVQNVIGTGVGLEPLIKNLRGTLMADLNEDVHEAFHDWWKEPGSVHTAGILSGPEIERYAVSNLIESGESFLRFVRQPFGDSKIPLSIELVESDRVMDQWTQQVAPNKKIIRMGIEMDNWHRPTGYWMWPNHPGDWQFSTFEPSNFVRMPADDICHMYIVDRWPQTRGRPVVPRRHEAPEQHGRLRGIRDRGGARQRGHYGIRGVAGYADAG